MNHLVFTCFSAFTLVTGMAVSSSASEAATGPSAPRGPFGASVSCLAVDPEDSTTIYLGTARGSLVQQQRRGPELETGRQGADRESRRGSGGGSFGPSNSLPRNLVRSGVQEFRPGRFLDRPISRVCPAGRSRLCWSIPARPPSPTRALFGGGGVQDQQRRENLEGGQPGPGRQPGGSPGHGSASAPDPLRRHPPQGALQEPGRGRNLEEPRLEGSLDYGGGGGS